MLLVYSSPGEDGVEQGLLSTKFSDVSVVNKKGMTPGEMEHFILWCRFALCRDDVALFLFKQWYVGQITGFPLNGFWTLILRYSVRASSLVPESVVNPWHGHTVKVNIEIILPTLVISFSVYMHSGFCFFGW